MHHNQNSVVLCSREDQSRYVKDLNEKNRKDRLKLVREQEKEAARALLQRQQARDREEQIRI
jgi:hypothetical protein